MTIDEQKLNDFLGKVVTDVGSAMSAALVVLGDQLGLWRALARSETPLSPAELASRTETSERYIREWLNAMAAGGYVTYCKDTKTYRLEPEQAVALADSESPAFVPGLFQVTAAMWAAEAKIALRVRNLDLAFLEFVGNCEIEVTTKPARPVIHFLTPDNKLEVNRAFSELIEEYVRLRLRQNVGIFMGNLQERLTYFIQVASISDGDRDSKSHSRIAVSPIRHR